VSREIDRRAAYRWVAELIDLHEEKWPLPTGVRDEVVRIREAMDHAGGLALSPIPPPAGAVEFSQPKGGPPHLVECQVECGACGGLDRTCPRCNGTGAVPGLRAAGGEGQEPAAALEGAPPPASGSELGVAFRADLPDLQRFAGEATCDEATRWLNQQSEGTLRTLGATAPQSQEEARARAHILECGRCGDAAQVRMLAAAARSA
jgi:hypothetical protein